MSHPTEEEYDSACVIERWAIGEEGERREAARRSILACGESAIEAARYARRSVMKALAAVDRAIDVLGLDA
jgi:hypothetical protein